MKKIYTILVLTVCYVLMSFTGCKKQEDNSKDILFQDVLVVKYPILEVNKISDKRLLVSYQLKDGKTDTFDNLTPDLYILEMREQVYLPIPPTITITYDYKEYRDGSYSMEYKEGVKYVIILPKNYPMH